ncbi:MAG: flagellar basal body rod protein FlgB [Alicyclobacillaceae bacterium]|nr:flagellar basal body rod protein FlgB [Alicyclobacillaceae bacterium]
MERGKGVDLFATGALQWLPRALDATALRQKMIASNVANVDTPGYHRKDVRFEDVFREALSRPAPLEGRRTDPRHFVIGLPPLSEVVPEVVTDNQTVYNTNGNNVDMDREMTALAANQTEYLTLLEDVNLHFAMLRYAITGR